MFGKLLTTMKNAGMLPQISETERAALEAGTVWVDGEFFSGNPDFSGMLAEAYPQLSEEEQAFLDGPVEELCHMVDVWDLQETRVIPDEVWSFLRENGFFGLIIPKEYGGFGMSTLGRSAVMMKTTSLGAVGSVIVIPNTLGAAELLIEYGTDEQKNQYLPGLARGDYVPCFGLTELTAGSDAASLKADGEVFKDEDGGVQIRLNFEKRYITLAPVANLISLAAHLRDPDNLLGKGEDAGVSVVMIEGGTQGLKTGDHHLPIVAFDNGPIVGEDVVVPATNIIGGPEQAGTGWRMLMEQLSGGRAVSLPAGGIAQCKAAAAATGPYSIVRQQFGIPVGMMEGPQSRVARIAGLAYAMESARVYVCAGIDNGQQPPVTSGILKYQTTEVGQSLSKDGMDVFAGAGVQLGPNNILAGQYIGAPVNITVEGANILTRTLIVFGQGAVRCHPYALQTLNALENDDVPAFRKATVAWVGHFAANGARAFVRAITRGLTVRSPVKGPTATFYRRLGWASSRFAFMADLALFLMGADLKAKGKISGRFADALSWQLFAFTTLRRYEAEGRRAEDLPLVEWACSYALQQIQDAFEGIYANFDAPVVGWFLRKISRPLIRLNPISSGPTDQLDRTVAGAIQKPGEQYDRITAGLATPHDDEPGMGRLVKAWRLIVDAQPATSKVHKAMRRKELPGDFEQALDSAPDQGVITAEEVDQIRSAESARLEAMQVDTFSPEQYHRTANPTDARPEIAKAANG